MCTLSYFLTDDGYELFFNRDEQKTREMAIAPSKHTDNAIYPIDPQGGGTWLGVSHWGQTLALLNDYQSAFDITAVKHSRGLLIPHLLSNNTPALSQLKNMDLSGYAPFKLCIFPDKLSLNNGHIAFVRWDTKKLIDCQVESLATSSGVELETVTQKRKQQFKQFIDLRYPASEQFLAFHYSKADQGQYAVNMQREDAMTVSISHIKVGNTIRFNYFDKQSQLISSISCLKVAAA
ncbi:NRDE family protein [Pseudoalteromonas sp. SWYJ118]|uniref:NRDE family protein n=1 Tax=unclassified Pseudoalteromonas TaxID=194690 RepID=UPI0018CD2158|nr:MULTISPECIES: NRDE family protein [unclassified Pseudoalteromonas]MBH0013382.1 NRDE family protein [Pseudoalteromonas sp. NZS100_1]MBH0075598.1 NRDE family protein [Pseudoalteromonas sp. SWYJ118]